MPSHWYDGIVDFLWAVPAPTETWAEIITGLAWPVVILVIYLCCRQHIHLGLSHLATRLGHDNIKLGNLFEMTKRDTVTEVDLDEHWEESLFGFATDLDENRELVEQWVVKNVSEDIRLSDFLINPEYTEGRQRAYENFKQKGLIK